MKISSYLHKSLFVLGFMLLGYAIFEHLSDHDLDSFDLLIMSIFALFTYVVLSFAHKHYNQKDNVKGIALAEFIHSTVDGAVIGFSFLVSPVVGFGALLAILTHELPKILGTVLIIKSITDNIKDTIKYSLLSQAGLPLVAVFVYFIGDSVGGISEEWGHVIGLASTATLIVILMRIGYHAFIHKGHDHVDCDHK